MTNTSQNRGRGPKAATKLRASHFMGIRVAASGDADRTAIGSEMTDTLLRLKLIEPADERPTYRIYRPSELGRRVLKERPSAICMGGLIP